MGEKPEMCGVRRVLIAGAAGSIGALVDARVARDHVYVEDVKEPRRAEHDRRHLSLDKARSGTS
jgi:FlaA1/EpsC-like NDP-sugar epimerase